MTTYAGGIAGTQGAFADGVGSNAGFSFPSHIAIDVSGNLLVADYNNQRIRKVSTAKGTFG